MLYLLFTAVEFGAPILAGAWSWFSGLPVAKRTATMHRWRESRVFLIRIIGDGLKITLTMMYLSHPKVARYIGTYKSCARPGDHFDVPIRSDARSLPIHRDEASSTDAGETP